jgi:hypothetical protein
MAGIEPAVEPDPASTTRATRSWPKLRRRKPDRERVPTVASSHATEVGTVTSENAESAVRSSDAGKTRADFPLAIRLVPIALALMVFGSLGPWAKNVFVTDYGIDRAGDVILVIALLAALVLILHARGGSHSPLPLLAALLATVALVILAADFRELVDDQALGPAWGLYAAFVGSAALVALSMSLLTKRH